MKPAVLADAFSSSSRSYSECKNKKAVREKSKENTISYESPFIRGRHWFSQVPDASLGQPALDYDPG
ncbi:MAG: hypothetical protein ABSA71_13425 [Desulfomonilia bacterium]